jgi:hypothetical protein
MVKQRVQPRLLDLGFHKPIPVIELGGRAGR